VPDIKYDACEYQLIIFLIWMPEGDFASFSELPLRLRIYRQGEVPEKHDLNGP